MYQAENINIEDKTYFSFGITENTEQNYDYNLSLFVGNEDNDNEKISLNIEINSNTSGNILSSSLSEFFIGKSIYDSPNYLVPFLEEFKIFRYNPQIDIIPEIFEFTDIDSQEYKSLLTKFRNTNELLIYYNKTNGLCYAYPKLISGTVTDSIYKELYGVRNFEGDYNIGFEYILIQKNENDSLAVKKNRIQNQEISMNSVSSTTYRNNNMLNLDRGSGIYYIKAIATRSDNKEIYISNEIIIKTELDKPRVWLKIDKELEYIYVDNINLSGNKTPNSRIDIIIEDLKNDSQSVSLCVDTINSLTYWNCNIKISDGFYRVYAKIIDFVGNTNISLSKNYVINIKYIKDNETKKNMLNNNFYFPFNAEVLNVTSDCLSHRSIGEISDAINEDSVLRNNLTKKILNDNTYYQTYESYIKQSFELKNKHYIINNCSIGSQIITAPNNIPLWETSTYKTACTDGISDNQIVNQIIKSDRGYLYDDICKAARTNTNKQKSYSSNADLLIENKNKINNN